ncbi:hypothetical protein R5W24_001787 [Gemmata sp. JC717]|uniref:hypothetical protein n=1 Tax=Gemmata algarum TaxID=2975278 RepID=UPI0021BB3F7B|nr:hypothetical protein [Gemmata algarum]MDY3552700.1 hypothetical protein [Gemmata algarum]
MTLTRTPKLRYTLRAARCLAPCVLMAAAACTAKLPDHPPVYPVRGELLVNGKPAVGAVVSFHPVGNAAPGAVRPQATVEADGTFRPNSFDPRDGAPAGEYALTVFWPGGKGHIGPDRLKGRYSDPTRPVRKVTVKAGDNVLEPIRID